MKIKITILFLLASIFGFSQDLESMKIEVQKIYDSTIEKKYDVLIESMYPKVFDIIPKKDMLDGMNKIFENDQMTITFEKVNPEFTFSEIITIEGVKYCIVEHNSKIKTIFKQKLEERKETYLASLKVSMTNYNVTLDEKTEVFTASGKAKMIVISDALTKGTWKFINYNSQSPIMEKVLGKEILEKLGL